jgi:hypothetical protein
VEGWPIPGQRRWRSRRQGQRRATIFILSAIAMEQASRRVGAMSKNGGESAQASGREPGGEKEKKE